MTTFAVTNTDELLDAVNYAISNLAGQGLQADIATGVISAPGDPNIIGYLYQWINVRYADNSTGTSNFSTSPTNRLYYGVRNTQTSTASSNPADYIWFPVTGGFGTTKFLFYSTTGGRQIQFAAVATAPSIDWQQVSDGVAIDLDVLTTVGAPGPTGPQGATGPVGPSGPSGPAGDRYATTSTTTLTIGTGSKSLTVETGLAYTAAQPVIVAHDASNDMTGTVTSYDSGTGALVVNIDTVNGSGTYSFWEVNLSGAAGVPGATGPTGPAGPTGPSQRGPIALAFILTPSTPVGASNATKNSWFSASRSNTVAPIGVGESPIAGDTAQFYWVAGGIGIVQTYNGTSWTDVTGQVINGNLVVVGTVRADQLATNSVTTDKLLANSVTTNKIAANAITATQIAANTITGNKIAAGTITATNIQTGTITATQIAANTITGNRIAAGTITTDKLAANVLTANTVVSTGATIGDFNSPGFWLQGSTGNARFGNTVSIGGNLSVAGLITSSGLIANTVSTSTIVPQAITDNGYYETNTSQTVISVPSGSLVNGTWYNSSTIPIFVPITGTQTNTPVYIWNIGRVTFTYVIVGSGANFSAVYEWRIIRQNTSGILPNPEVVVTGSGSAFINALDGPFTTANSFDIGPYTGLVDILPAPGNYQYLFEFRLNIPTGRPGYYQLRTITIARWQGGAFGSVTQVPFTFLTLAVKR